MARKKRFGPAEISIGGHEPGLSALSPSEWDESIRKWYIIGEEPWRIVGANTWYIVGEDYWFMVGANAWYIMAEDYWYIVARGVTVANLRQCDLYLDEPSPRLVVRGKGSRERSVYLSPQAEQTLRAYLKERPKSASDYVFLSYLWEGMSTTAIHKRLVRYRERAEVQLNAHRLRHSFANDLLSAGAPVTTIQQLLGHRWLETTQIYVQANDQQVQADYYAACHKLEGWMAVAGAP